MITWKAGCPPRNNIHLEVRCHESVMHPRRALTSAPPTTRAHPGLAPLRSGTKSYGGGQIFSFTRFRPLFVSCSRVSLLTMLAAEGDKELPHMHASRKSLLQSAMAIPRSSFVPHNRFPGLLKITHKSILQRHRATINLAGLHQGYP